MLPPSKISEGPGPPCPPSSYAYELYMSNLCQPGSRIIRTFSDVKKPLLFPDLAVKAAKQKVKKAIRRQRRLGLAAG